MPSHRLFPHVMPDHVATSVLRSADELEYVSDAVNGRDGDAIDR